MEPQKIAALITCHNRKEKTLLCLAVLNTQVSEGKFDLKVYVVDSGSTDGTVEAISKRYPEVKLISCGEDIYWCGGMRLAWAEAIKEEYDYYLWLNDDTILYPDAVKKLLETSKKIDGSSRVACSIIVGSTCDPITKVRTYGGYVWSNGPIPVIPAENVKACDTMNGNIVLIPKIVSNSIGNLSHEFTHAFGDIDYGLRARKEGYSIWLASNFQGICEEGNTPLWTLPKTPLLKRLRMLHSPKGLHPKEYIIFHKRHNKKWIIAVLKLYLRAFAPRIWRIKKWENYKLILFMSVYLTIQIAVLGFPCLLFVLLGGIIM